MHVHRLGEASSSITSNVVRRGAPHTCVVVVNLVRGCNKEWQGHVFVGSMDHIPIILGSKFLETPFTERMRNYFATCCEHYKYGYFCFFRICFFYRYPPHYSSAT